MSDLLLPVHVNREHSVCDDSIEIPRWKRHFYDTRQINKLKWIHSIIEDTFIVVFIVTVLMKFCHIPIHAYHQTNRIGNETTNDFYEIEKYTNEEKRNTKQSLKYFLENIAKKSIETMRFNGSVYELRRQSI